MTGQVDATDLEIVDAFQVSPKASWAAVGKAVGLSEMTVARRWRRLVGRREVWISAALHPEVSMGAIIEVRCEPARLDDLVDRLVEHPDVITVSRTTGAFQLYVIMLSTGLPRLLRRLRDGFPELQDAVETRQSVFRRLYGGVHWRQGLLDQASVEGLLAEEPLALSRGVALDEADRDLFMALNVDGRLTAAELATRLGGSRHTISRRLAQLERGRQLIYRCDVARPLFDLPLGLVVLLRAPDERAAETADALGSWVEARLSAVTLSSTNIVLILGLHDLADAERQLVRLAREHPEAEVVDRRIVTQTHKVYGRVLDDTGRVARTIPVDPWF